MTRRAYPIPGLTKHQRRIVDELCTGNYSLACVFPHPKALAKLLELGVVVRDADQTIGVDRFGTIRIPTYHVPLWVHYAWCVWCSEQPEVAPE